MSINSIGAGGATPFSNAARVGETPDPQALKAQANAQADLLRAVQGVESPAHMAMTRLSDGQGVDLYM